MKYIVTLLFSFFGCHAKQTNTGEPIVNNDSLFTKERAQSELNKLRSSVTDSGFANILDISLQLQKMEFDLEKADSTRKEKGFGDSLMAINGSLLYKKMMKLYLNALYNSKDESDINYYTAQNEIPKQEWLDIRFKNKKTYEAIISVTLLKKDVAIASMIINKADSKENREMVEEQYKKLIAIFKSYE